MKTNRLLLPVLSVVLILSSAQLNAADNGLPKPDSCKAQAAKIASTPVSVGMVVTGLIAYKGLEWVNEKTDATGHLGDAGNWVLRLVKVEPYFAGTTVKPESVPATKEDIAKLQEQIAGIRELLQRN